MDQKRENERSQPQVTLKIQHENPKRRRYRTGDPDFQPPDGGWGWMIVFACGFSNLCTFPMFQQFGLVFRKRFEELGISHSQTTSVINMNSAFNAGMGLTNGPLFRRFSYRQVAMFGSLAVAVSLLLCRFCDSFWGYMVLYSAFYGSGIGITQSSNALALNTYFKKKRRVATGFSWTTTGLGPVVWPYIIVFLNELYGIDGTILMFAGLALHAFMCSLLLQPVEWHTKFRDTSPESAQLIANGYDKTKEKSHKEWVRLGRQKQNIFSSQYLRNEDDPIYTGYEITDPGTPMMIKANDGWYSRSNLGSRKSLASPEVQSKVTSRQSSVILSNRASAQNSMPMSTRPSYSNLPDSSSKLRTPNLSSINLPEFGRERSTSQARRKLSQAQNPGLAIKEEQESEVQNEDLLSSNHEPHHEKEVLTEAIKILTEYKEHQDHEEEEQKHHESINDMKEPADNQLSVWKKISIFFDFELFKDPIYVNLMLGITIANFAELNFSVLTPMVLKEFNFGEFQTATFMSLLGATDILVRFFIPFIADKVGWDNKTFFLIGVLAMALGRIILVHTQTYGIGLFVAAMIGAGKGLRTIFIALVIPSYVPLERLPAASGLQLATSGLLFIILGPIVGWVRQVVGNYVITLHLLNLCTYFTAICWIIEDLIIRSKKKQPSCRKPSKSFKT